MDYKARKMGTTIGIWSLTGQVTSEASDALLKIGYGTLEGILLFSFSPLENPQLNFLRFSRLQSAVAQTRLAKNPSDVWNFVCRIESTVGQRTVVVISNCHAFQNPTELVPLIELLNRRGADVVLVGKPMTAFDSVFMSADIKIRAHDPCQFVDNRTQKVCGRQAQKKVWFNPAGKVPLIDFAEGYLRNILPLAKMLRLKRAVLVLLLVLKRINEKYFRYPKIGENFDDLLDERFYRSLLYAVLGFVVHENRCRSHNREGIRSGNRGGNILVITGPPNSGKSRHAAIRLENLAQGSILGSKKVLAFAPISSPSDSGLVPDYNPTVISRAEEIVISDETEEVVFDETELFPPSVIEVAINLATAKGINVTFVMYGPHWSGRPFNNLQRILSVADEIVNLPSRCFFESCGEPATRTALTLEENGERKFLPSLTLSGDLIPAVIKKRLRIRVVAACLTHCDQVTLTASAQNLTATEPKGDFWHELLGSILGSGGVLIEDFRQKRPATIVLAISVIGLLIMPEIAWVLGWPIRVFLVRPVLILITGLLLGQLLSMFFDKSRKPWVFRIMTVLVWLYLAGMIDFGDLIIRIWETLGKVVAALDGYVTDQTGLTFASGKVVISFILLFSFLIWSLLKRFKKIKRGD